MQLVVCVCVAFPSCFPVLRAESYHKVQMVPGNFQDTWCFRKQGGWSYFARYHSCGDPIATAHCVHVCRDGRSIGCATAFGCLVMAPHTFRCGVSVDRREGCERDKERDTKRERDTQNNYSNNNRNRRNPRPHPNPRPSRPQQQPKNQGKPEADNNRERHKKCFV